MELYEEQLLTFIECYKSACYICSVCKEIIFPEVSCNEYKNEYEIKIDKGYIRGKIASQILIDNVCKKCQWDNISI